jgi:hypothetical protein
MTADDTRDALEVAADATEKLVRQYVMLFGGKGRDEQTVIRSLDDLRAALAAARRDPEPVASADAAYRERNAVVAALVRSNGWPASLVPAPDADGWWIVYAETPQGQVSWHVGASDLDLFDGVPAEYVKWDGHTTDEKYPRLAAIRGTEARASLDVDALTEAMYRVHSWDMTTSRSEALDVAREYRAILAEADR